LLSSHSGPVATTINKTVPNNFSAALQSQNLFSPNPAHNFVLITTYLARCRPSPSAWIHQSPPVAERRLSTSTSLSEREKLLPSSRSACQGAS
jgi:hypothetical protein